MELLATWAECRGNIFKSKLLAYFTRLIVYDEVLFHDNITPSFQDVEPSCLM